MLQKRARRLFEIIERLILHLTTLLPLLVGLVVNLNLKARSPPELLQEPLLCDAF